MIQISPNLQLPLDVATTASVREEGAEAVNAKQRLAKLNQEKAALEAEILAKEIEAAEKDAAPVMARRYRGPSRCARVPVPDGYFAGGRMIVAPEFDHDTSKFVDAGAALESSVGEPWWFEMLSPAARKGIR